MMIIPAVDLMDGKCVQLVEGKPWSAKVIVDDPVETAMRWKEMGARRLHVIDLDAALGSGSNEEIVQRILSLMDIPVQVGGGVRDDDKADRLLSSGAAQIIVGTRGVTDRDWLNDLSQKYPDRVIVAVDARGSQISIKGWTESSGLDLLDFVKSIGEIPLFGILYTNIEREGKLAGINRTSIAQLTALTSKRLMVAGGISSLEDLREIEAAGAAAAVLGMAIYKGKINLKEALERFA